MQVGSSSIATAASTFVVLLLLLLVPSSTTITSSAFSSFQVSGMMSPTTACLLRSCGRRLLSANARISSTSTATGGEQLRGRCHQRFATSTTTFSAAAVDDTRDDEEERIIDNNNNNNNNIKSYNLNGIGYGTKVEIKTNTGHQIETDIPKTMGGQDTAPQPVEMLLSSWMGCTQATIMYVGRQIINNNNNNTRKQRIIIEKLGFHNIVAIRDERGSLQLPIHEIPEIPSRILSITGTIQVYIKSKSSSSSESDDEKELLLTTEEFELLKEQTEVRCPIANMILSSGCTIDVDWIQLRA
jgi:uncharacterized OsmC-like protein